MSMKNSKETMRNRTRDLPACSAVPQPTAPPRVPVAKSSNVNYISILIITINWVVLDYVLYTIYFLIYIHILLFLNTTEIHHLKIQTIILSDIHASPVTETLSSDSKHSSAFSSSILARLWVYDFWFKELLLVLRIESAFYKTWWRYCILLVPADTLHI